MGSGQPYERLKISEEITAESFVASVQDTAQAAGKRVIIHELIASAVFSKNAVVRLVWAYGIVGEETDCWTSKGSEVFPHKMIIDGNHALPPNGVRKVAVICDNAETVDVFMSTQADVENE